MGKKIPIRKCVGCNERKEKKDLIRIVYNRDNKKVLIDKGKKAQGRGVYICPKLECLENAKKSKSIKRSLKISISDEIYEKLKKEIDMMKG
ncbi:MAG: RNase P modulator RnpM [Bacillota bacterium]